MNEVDRSLKEAFAARVEGAVLTRQISSRRLRLRRGLTAGAMTVALVAVGSGGFVLANRVVFGEAPGPRMDVIGPAGDPSTDEAALPRPLTPTVEIVEGEAEGRQYSLEAFIAEGPDEREMIRGVEALCFVWSLGENTNSPCLVDWQAGVEGPMGVLQDFSTDGASGFYGIVSSGVARVLVELESGETRELGIYDAPADLGVDFRFFAGVTPASDLALVAFDKAGKELSRHVTRPGMP